MQPNRETWRTCLLSVLLASATLAAFAPVVRNDFIKFDDGFYVVHNPHVAGGLNWSNLRWALRTGYQGNWHPVTWVSHMVDVQLFGMRPGWHHLISLLFHTANAVLLFVWLQRLTTATWSSLSVATLFALHPLRVESVAWIAERKDVLSTFFLLLTLMAYACYAKLLGRTSSASPASSAGKVGRAELVLPNRRAYVLALLCFALGLMSKPMLVTTPFLLLLLDFWPLGRQESAASINTTLKTLIREKIPFFVLSAISSIVTLAVQEKGHATYLEIPPGGRLANAVASYWIYLGKALWPLRLSIFYPHPLSGASGSHLWPPALLVLAVAGLLAISFAAWRFRRVAPWLMVGWFWFLGTLVPVIGIIQVGGQALADRYTYVPLIGIFIAVTWTASAVAQRWAETRPVLTVSGVTVVVLCAVMTQRQVKFWHNDFTVFNHALEVTPNNALALYHLGIAYRDQKQTAKAMDKFLATVAVDPSYALAYPEIGGILEDQGKAQEALQVYQQAVKQLPGSGQLHNLLATRLWAQGKQEEAVAQYAAAVRCNPDYADAHFNYGMALASRGQFEDASAQFAAACRLQPDDTEALGCLAEALMKQGLFSQAEDRLRELAELAPTNAAAHQKLGMLLAERGNFDGALSQFQQAVALSPNWPDALNALAWLLATNPRVEFRKPIEAVNLAERACILAGGKQSRYWSTLDVAYAGAGRFADAVQAATKAEQLAIAEGQTNAAQSAAHRIEDYRKRMGQSVNQ
jgi:tetratricopeptide (TPR) repeat protein